MKICYKCGHENQDNEIYCKTCGYAFPLSAPKNGGAAGLASVGSDEITAALRTREFFLAALAQSALVFLQFINNIFIADRLSDLMYEFFAKRGLFGSYMIYNIGDFLIKSVCWFNWLLPVLLCIGLWQLFAAGRGKRHADAGLSLIKAVSIIYIVLSALAASAAGAVTLLCTFGRVFGGAVWTALLCLFFEALAAGFIVYHAKVLNLVSSARRAINKNVSVKNPSYYIVAVNFIAALCILTNIFSGGVLNLLTRLLSIAYLILISLCIINFRQKRR